MPQLSEARILAKPLLREEEPPQQSSPSSRMVEGFPQQPLLGQGYRAPLSAKVFSSWDFCIRVREAATIKKHEISNELKVCARQSAHVWWGR